MGLSEEQTEELYRTTLKNRTDIGWIRECLEKNNRTMVNLSKRQSILESEQSILKGKLGAFVLVLTLGATVIINGFMWISSHFIAK